jgi:hypothetical protein
MLPSKNSSMFSEQSLESTWKHKLDVREQYFPSDPIANKFTALGVRKSCCLRQRTRK